MVKFRLLILLFVVVMSSCGDSAYEEYYDNGNLKSRVQMLGDTLVSKYYYNSKGQQLKTAFKSIDDTVHVAQYYDENGVLTILSKLQNQKVQFRRENGEWLVGPQDGAKYLSVIVVKPYFPQEIDDHLRKAISSDGLFVHLPDTSKITAVLFEQEIDIYSDSTGFIHGVHTYFSIP